MKYWLAQNSWGDQWGEKGWFKIIKGVNALGIESMVEFGIPEIIGQNSKTVQS